MAGEYSEFFKAASPLRGGYPGAAMGAGTWGATTVASTIAVSTTLASCVILLTQVYGVMPASGAVVTSISTNGMALLTIPAVCSGSWIAIGY